MALEIERKFLVDTDIDYEKLGTSHTIIQGYLNRDIDRTIRVRLIDQSAYLTIKGKSSDDGTTRYEFETEIKFQEAEQLLKLCYPTLIEKTRTKVEIDGMLFEIDRFHGANHGLLLAEIELTDQNQSFTKPKWLGKEVTGDKRFYNSYLSEHPYTTWK